ncbi:hypothetical protein Pmani_007284 [Petrolisthes manimaculis]|uniref:Uncharacterized protein n=1 Tax=Petrolisthes manimaculis TaxID=1843537 RepID=A0AAE1QAX7_9EUCA|nr:hypothetical protein Pmani_007284 [Petrolisthes manimaculis]
MNKKHKQSNSKFYYGLSKEEKNEEEEKEEKMEEEKEEEQYKGMRNGQQLNTSRLLELGRELGIPQVRS